MWLNMSQMFFAAMKKNKKLHELVDERLFKVETDAPLIVFSVTCQFMRSVPCYFA